MTRALECIASIYSSLDAPDAWQDALESLHAAFASDASAIGLYECARGRGRYLWSVGLQRHLVENHAARPTEANPWLDRVLRSGRPGQAWLGRWVVRPEQLAASEFYEQWLRPRGLLHFSCGIIWRAGDEVLCLEKYRRVGRAPFNRRDLIRYGRFLPHLGRAWNVYLRIYRQEVETRGSPAQILLRSPPAASGWKIRRHAADEGGGAQGFVDDGQVLDLHPASHGDQSTTRRTTMHPDGTRRQNEPSRRSVPAASNGHAPAGILEFRRAGDRTAMATFMEPPDTVDRARWRESVSTMPYFRRASEEERLRLLYQLTRAEARLAQLLARGLTLREAAARLGVGITTVRTHLQRIYEKTGTHRQSELVHFLLTAPADPQPREA